MNSDEDNQHELPSNDPTPEETPQNVPTEPSFNLDYLKDHDQGPDRRSDSSLNESDE